MDTKRLILAVVLSIVVIVAYQYLFMPAPKPLTQAPAQTASPATPAPAPVKGATPSEAAGGDLGSLFTEAKAAVPASAPQKVAGDVKADAEEKLVLETELYTAELSNRGAALTAFRPRNYRNDQGKPLNLVVPGNGNLHLYPLMFFPGGENGVFDRANRALFSVSGGWRGHLRKGERREVVFRYASLQDDCQVEKRLTFTGGTYLIGLEIRIVQAGKALAAPVAYGPELEGTGGVARAGTQGLKAAGYNGKDLESQEFSKVKTQQGGAANIEKAQGVLPGSFVWSAYESLYFAAIFRHPAPTGQAAYAVIRAPNPAEPGKRLDYNYLVVENPTALYLGPKDETALKAVAGEFPGIGNVIEYGFFGTLARLMLKGLVWIHSFVPNYGWAIILFTIILKVILFPLTYSSSVSMGKMQTLQPKLKAIQKKYKGSKDPELRRQMNMEVMALYKQEKVNPAGGCLPLLLQLPILWGIFRLLSVSINLRQEPWLLWIHDLSIKDPYYILPILMGVTQLVVQRMTPSGGDDIQRKMMYIMPVIMVVMFAAFPAGLNLYWFATNLLQIGQQKIINERVFNKKKEEEKERRALKRKKGAKEQ